MVASAAWNVRPGQWIEAGTPIGVSPDLTQEVRSPVSGVIKALYPVDGLLEIVLERRREYEEMDD
jgi:Na+-translocating ferredoxin:NAD+ oxidoreductase RnfC subunit